MTYDRSIVAMLVTVFASACASVAGVTALGLQVYDLTGRELDLGLLGLAEFAPAAVLVLFTGTVADRFDKRVVCAWSGSVIAAVALALAAYAATDPDRVAPIFALVIAFGIGRAFLAPAARALPADIVDAATLPDLQARRAAAWQAAIIVGPVIAGALYTLGPHVPYLAMAALAAVEVVAVGFVRILPPGEDEVITPPRARLGDALEGLRFIRRTPLLLGAISLDLFAVLFGGAVALLPALAVDRLGAGPVGFGWLRAAGGIGAAVVTLSITRRPIRRKVGRTLLIAVAVFGVATITLGATTVYAVAFCAMLVLAGADAVSVYIRSTLVPLATPRDKRGRVTAVEAVFIGASNELGAFESGVTGHFLGAPGAVILGGAATLVVAGVYWTRFQPLRDVDRFPDPSAVPPPAG